MSDPAVHQDLPLAAEFPATDRAEWLRLVEKALKDRPFEKLVSRTYDGIAVEPLYGRAAGVAPVAGRAPTHRAALRMTVGGSFISEHARHP